MNAYTSIHIKTIKLQHKETTLAVMELNLQTLSSLLNKAVCVRAT